MLKLNERLLTLAVVLSACGNASHDDNPASDAGVLDGAADASRAADANSPHDAEAGPSAPADASSDAARTDVDGGPQAALQGVRLVALGASTTCAARAADVVCWGAVLGAQPARSDAAPTVLGGISAPVSLAVDDTYGCAATSTETRCWGSYVDAQLHRITSAAAGPAWPGGTQVVAGDTFTCVLSAAGGVQCFGSITTGLSGAAAITGYAGHVCALKSNRAWCWGSNDSGESDYSDSHTQLPSAQRAVPLNPQFAQLSAGGSFTCATTTDKHVICWGSNAQGQLGRSPQSTLIGAIDGLSDVAEVGAGGTLACAVTTAGAVSCWGDGYGFTPVAVALAPAAHVVVGNRVACAILQDQTLACWRAGEAPTLVEGP